MTDAVAIQITVTAGAVVIAGIGCLTAYISLKTHKAVNSRMDEFKQLFKDAIYAKAKLEGKTEEKADELDRQKTAVEPK